jgi:hypothetical protein
MTFQQLIEGAEVLSQSGSSSGNPPVTGVEYDSRRVSSGSVFLAMNGETSDGNRFIGQAIAAGAVAVVTDSAAEVPRPGVAWAQVAHGRRALGRLSANFYHRPAERIANTGITGTNGKSTTAFLLESILGAAGRKTALVGTIEYHVAGKILPAPHTTPESLELNRLFADALSHGVTESIMEVSSHALEQQRVFGVPFDVAVFTNLTRDHLDYHGTMSAYGTAKARLLWLAPTLATVALAQTPLSFADKLYPVLTKAGCNAIPRVFRCSIWAPMCRRRGRRGRHSCCYRRCWGCSRMRRAASCMSTPRGRPGCQVALTDLRQGRRFDIRFWRDGKESKVLKGRPDVVESPRIMPLAAP